MASEKKTAPEGSGGADQSAAEAKPAAKPAARPRIKRSPFARRQNAAKKTAAARAQAGPKGGQSAAEAAKAAQAAAKPAPKPTPKPAPKPAPNPAIVRQKPQPTPTVAAGAAAERVAELERTVKRQDLARQLTHEFVGNTGGMKKLMDVIFERVLTTLEAEAGSLWIVDTRSEQNICHLAEGPAKDRIVGLRLPPGKGIVGEVIAKQKPEVILDCSKDERFSGDVDSKTGFRTLSMICVPMVIDQEPYGAIQIVNKKSGIGGLFDEDDRKLVEDLAISAAVSVKNAKLMESESRVKEMNTLMTISRDVSSSLDMDMVLDTVVNTANELVETTESAVALVNEATDTLFLATLGGGEKVDKNDANQKAALTLMEQVKKAGRTSYIPDLKKFKAENKDPENPWVKYMEANELKSVWATPLKDEEGALGVLWYGSDEPGFASGNKSDMLNILAAQSSVALRNASLFKNIPLGSMLGSVSGASKHLISTKWRRLAFAAALIATLLAGLHYIPAFRWVSGEALVEARLGHGVFLPVAGRIKNVTVGEGDRVNKGDVIANLDDNLIRLTLIEAESKLAILERQIIEARAISDASAMSRAAIERVAARAQVKKARADLEHVSIKAPLSGFVLTPRTQELEGRDFPIGSELMRLANPQNFVVVVTVPEEDLLDLEIGQEVRGVLRSQPGKGFTGKVRHIGLAYQVPAEALDPAAAEGEELEGFIAEVTVESADVPLRPGMTGQALIHTPDSSTVIRMWRRLRNFLAFWFGIGL